MGNYLIANCDNLNREIFKAAKTDNFQGCSSNLATFKAVKLAIFKAAKPGKFQSWQFYRLPKVHNAITT